MAKTMSVKDRENARMGRAVAGMLSGESEKETAERKENTETSVKGNLQHENEIPLAEQVVLLKKQLEEAKKQVDIKSSKKERIKNVRVNLLMYKDIADALKEKCRKQKISVNDLMNQLAEKWVNGDI